MKKTTVLLLLGVAALSILAACGKKPTSDVSLFNRVCSADEALSAARKRGAVVMEGLRCTAGKGVWDAFYEAVSAGKRDRVLCAMYYTLDPERVSPELYEQEKDQYPVLYFYLLEYDGSAFTVTVRQSNVAEPDHQDTFPYLLHFTGDTPAQSIYYAYDAYVLVDDPTATMEGIWAGVVSSSSLIAPGYRHCTVYMNYMG